MGHHNTWLHSIIFALKGKMTLAVHHQVPVSDIMVDPFKPDPNFMAKLYSSDLEDELVQVEWVISHLMCNIFSACCCLVSLMHKWPFFFPILAIQLLNSSQDYMCTMYIR